MTRYAGNHCASINRQKTLNFFIFLHFWTGMKRLPQLKDGGYFQIYLEVF